MSLTRSPATNLLMSEPSQLAQTLAQVSAQLTALSYDWALVGGLAISTRCEPRFTHDLDIAISVISDEQAELLTFKLIRRGAQMRFLLDHDEQGRLSMVSLLIGSSSVSPVDLLFASSGIEAEVIQGATLLEVFPQVQAPVASIAHLTALKLLSVSQKRLKDLADLSALREVATDEDQKVTKEACALITQRGFHRGLNLSARFDRWINGHLPIE